MHVDRRLLNWGVFFIALGAIPLAVRAGGLEADKVSRAWTLWPLLLVAAGVGLLLRRTPFAFAGGLAAALVAGLIGGGLLAGGVLPGVGCSSDHGGTAFPTRSGDLGSPATVELQLDCGDLTVRSGTAAGWTVEGVADDGNTPDIDASNGRLEVRTHGRGVGVLHAPDRWTVTLPAASTIDLQANVNAGTGRLDLGGAKLDSVDLRINAGSARVDLGQVVAIDSLNVHLNAAGDTRIVLPNLNMQASIDLNVGSVVVCAPEAAGLRVTAKNNLLSSNNFGSAGLSHVGDAWESDGYAAAATKIELETNVDVGNIRLEIGGCGG